MAIIRVGDRSFTCLPEETIVEAGKRQGFGFPVACRNGVCERCMGQLLSGSIRVARKDHTIHAGEAAAERVLYCVAHALTDCEIVVPDLTAPGELPIVDCSCQVLAVTPLNHDISRVTLQLPAGRPPRWHAGQYLLLKLDEAAAYSIANAPREGERQLQLHIRHNADNPAAERIIAHLKSEPTVAVQLPLGERFIDQPEPRPHWFICGSTGLAPARAMIERLGQLNFEQPVRLFVGARTAADLYLQDELVALSQALPDMQWQVALSDETAEGCFKGLVHEAALAHPRPESPVVHVGGSPAMAWAVFDALVAAGIGAADIHSDVFDYAPR